MTATWHVDDAALARWIHGADGSVTGASVEQHLIACEQCRAKVQADPVVAAVWSRVQDAVEVPRASLLERLLRSTGLPAADARIVSVSPTFRAALLVGLTALLAFVTTAGAYGSGRGLWAFLLVAPLVPALAVALGYEPELDEALESECATPYSKVRLVLLRSAALLTIGLPALVLASLVLPGDIAFWWLVPAAGCTTLVLALSTWVTPLTAVGAVGTGWLVFVGSHHRGETTPTELLDEGWLAAYAVVAILSLLLLALRREQLVAWRRP
jgi:hypothetical protein